MPEILKVVLKRVLRMVVLVFIGAYLIGCFAINSVMFHPKLFFHGTADGVIPYAHGKELFACAAEPKEFVTIEGGNHNDFVLVMGIEAYLGRIRQFLAKEN